MKSKLSKPRTNLIGEQTQVPGNQWSRDADPLKLTRLSMGKIYIQLFHDATLYSYWMIRHFQCRLVCRCRGKSNSPSYLCKGKFKISKWEAKMVSESHVCCVNITKWRNLFKKPPLLCFHCIVSPVSKVILRWIKITNIYFQIYFWLLVMK